MKLSLSFVSIFIIFASPLLNGEANFYQYSTKKCQVWINGYSHFANWFKTDSHITIEAVSACASRLGRPLEMENVNLSIIKNGKLIAKFHSPKATLSQHQNRFLIGRSINQSDSGFIKKVQSLLVDLKKGTVRSPDGIYVKLEE